MNQKNIVPIYFPKEAQEAILNLADQYQINLKDEDFYDFSKEGPEVLIFNLAKRITNRAGKFKDISQILQKELNMSPENAAKLALDIKDKIVPLAEIIEPEKKEIPSEPSGQELLIEKIKGEILEYKVEENPQTPAETIKKVEVEDVEENAEKLKKQREETARPGTAGGELQRKGQTDKYREPTD